MTVPMTPPGPAPSSGADADADADGPVVARAAGPGQGGGYRPPPLAWRLPVAVGLPGLAAMALSEPADRWIRSTVRVPLPDRRVVQGVVVGTVAVHVVEAASAVALARRSGLAQPWRWGLGTLTWGFPTLLRLRAARPDR